jgi:hypothetical protein
MLSGSTLLSGADFDRSATNAGIAPAPHSKNYLCGEPVIVFLYFSAQAFDAGISNARPAAFLAPNQ